jgi:peptidoglycan/xylan/chitin deacetylase (PgdA/CDA1 family)
MMSSAQVRGLAAAGFEIGGHTVNHPILARLDDSDAKREIAEGRDRLEAITGTRIRLFAYPNGRPNEDYSRQSVELVRAAGFDGAVSTSRGAARAGSDPFQIPRFTPWQLQPWRFAVQMASNLARTAPVYAH